jgi:hypothetical protein
MVAEARPTASKPQSTAKGASTIGLLSIPAELRNKIFHDAIVYPLSNLDE